NRGIGIFSHGFKVDHQMNPRSAGGCEIMMTVRLN
ncbi:hypothetical protein ECTW15901_4561, partial [Escherichia coli TW15901]